MSAQANQVTALSEWENSWQEGRIDFYQPQVSGKILRQNRTWTKEYLIFFPLCAVDMKWYEAGRVTRWVGVEIAEKGIKEFFEDKSLKCNEEPVPEIPRAKKVTVTLICFSLQMVLRKETEHGE